MKALLEEYLKYSESLRKGFIESLGTPVPDALQTLKAAIGGEVPRLLQEIYTTVAGTQENEVADELIDFIPGFQLIHINQWVDEYEFLKEEMGENLLPILKGEEGAYYVLHAITGEILILFVDEFKLQDVIFHDDTHFLQTLIANYQEHVYFVDKDGWLDFDDDKEVKVAQRINPDVDYWGEGF